MSELRLAILDSDSGFVRVLVKRAGDLGWQYRRLEAAPRSEDFVAMRVNALVVDLEVLARVEAVVRRRKRASERVDTGPLVAGELEIRADQFQAFVRSTSIDLTRREFEVLQLLAQAEGKVLQREDIYQAVWGYAMAHGDRSVDVFVRKVRQKLEKASPDWSYIHTHFGVGYRFDAEPRDPDEPDSISPFPSPPTPTSPTRISPFPSLASRRCRPRRRKARRPSARRPASPTCSRASARPPG